LARDFAAILRQQSVGNSRNDRSADFRHAGVSGAARRKGLRCGADHWAVRDPAMADQVFAALAAKASFKAL
jgi:hypothetical protein